MVRSGMGDIPGRGEALKRPGLSETCEQRAEG